VVCVPQISNSNGSTGVLDIAAPLNGAFSGIAIMQSANFASDSGCGNGSGNKAGPVDWCQAGNSPTIDSQGLIYMPQAEMSFAGAISKFNGTGALTCVGFVMKSFNANGGGAVLNNTAFGSGATTDCNSAGVTLPNVKGTHLYYQALVG
jgi:hypothetical protein